jgi:hypothetical protein
MSLAWLMRWNQRIDESMAALADIQHEAKWEDLVPDRLLGLSEASLQEAYVEALLLKGSLFRAQGQLQKASSWLRRVTQKSDQILEDRGFRLLFELGMDHWVHEETAEAMEYFLLAQRKARTPAEKSFASFNLLLCLEAIDLPREHVEEKINTLAKEWSASGECAHLKEQWGAYLLRKEFFHAMQLRSDEKATGQELFLRSWAGALPYADPCWNEKALFDLEQGYVWQGAYRSRTLNGIWLPADIEFSRVGDAVDRLYLWTWWWMADHPQIGTDKIIWTLESILRSLDLDSQGKINLLLLRNALAWVVLVEPAIEDRVRSIMSRLKKVSSTRFEMLEVEFLLNQALVQSLHQERSPQIDKHLKRFPSFWKIYREGMVHSRTCLLPRLQRRLHPFENQENDQCHLVVDLSKKEIRVLKSYQVMKSDGLSRLFSLLHQHGRARFEEILGETEEMDPRRVYNLVVRARKLTSNSAIQIRGQEVIRGAAWPRVVVLHERFDHAFSADSVCSEKPGSLIESKAYLQAAKALHSQGFSRKELEKSLKVSKATACRMIENWLEQDCLSISGRAKAIRYEWKN